MAWLHGVGLPWSGPGSGTPFATSSQGFPEASLDATMQGLFYHRLRYFEAAVSSTACFVVEHRPFKKKVTDMIFNFANLFAALWDFHRTRSNGMIFCNILHEWNLRVDHLSLASGIRIPAKKYMVHYWKFAAYFAVFAPER